MSVAFTSRKFAARGPFSRITFVRFASSHSTHKSRLFRQTYNVSRIGIVTGSVIAVSAWLASTTGTDSTIHADAPDSSRSKRPPTPLSTLIRSYIVYSLCSVPAIVDWSPTILATLFSIPGLRQITEAIVRVTFFDHFVGGDTAQDAIPLIEQLRNENKGCLFAYSVEVDEHEAAGQDKSRDNGRPKQPINKQIIEETLRCIDVAAGFEDKHSPGQTTGRRTWVALKLTAFVSDAKCLLNFSKYLVANRSALSTPVPFPGMPLPSDLDNLSASHPAKSLSEADLFALRELHNDLETICNHARRRGVKLIVDAEHSWYQPAIDAFTLSLMREFNKLPEQTRRLSWFFGSAPAPTSQPAVQPLIYGTYQAYLRRAPEFLAQSLEQARIEGFSLGVKLVRGAYHPHELNAHKSGITISPEALPPVHLTKTDTDSCYDACARLLVSEIRKEINAGQGRGQGIGVLFGTHNLGSCELILDELLKQGLARSEREEGRSIIAIEDQVNERITFGQLYGMSDALTNYLVDTTRTNAPFVLKYIPYGTLVEVMPYLSRRAIENKSVLGNGAAAEERRRAAGEIWTRILG